MEVLADYTPVLQPEGLEFETVAVEMAKRSLPCPGASLRFLRPLPPPPPSEEAARVSDNASVPAPAGHVLVQAAKAAVRQRNEEVAWRVSPTPKGGAGEVVRCAQAVEVAVRKHFSETPFLAEL